MALSEEYKELDRKLRQLCDDLLENRVTVKEANELLKTYKLVYRLTKQRKRREKA